MLMSQRQMLHAQNLRFPHPERLPKVYLNFFSYLFGTRVIFFIALNTLMFVATRLILYELNELMISFQSVPFYTVVLDFPKFY